MKNLDLRPLGQYLVATIVIEGKVGMLRRREVGPTFKIRGLWYLQITVCWFEVWRSRADEWVYSRRNPLPAVLFCRRWEAELGVHLLLASRFLYFRSSTLTLTLHPPFDWSGYLVTRGFQYPASIASHAISSFYLGGEAQCFLLPENGEYEVLGVGRLGEVFYTFANCFIN